MNKVIIILAEFIIFVLVGWGFLVFIGYGVEIDKTLAVDNDRSMTELVHKLALHVHSNAITMRQEGFTLDESINELCSECHWLTINGKRKEIKYY